MADTVSSLLVAARLRLREADVGDEALDARLLLQQAAGLSHSDIVADPGKEIAAEVVEVYEMLVRRRLAFEPVSRILGEREFYGRAFKITPDVLDPRPDTETLIEAALPLLKPGLQVLDLGTGSGAIIVTLLAERPEVMGVAVDLSPAALAVATDNAKRHGVLNRLMPVTGSWFDRVEGRFDLIVSNPPYIPAADIAGLEPDVRNFDPLLALAGGDDGLQAYRAIAAGAHGHLEPQGRIMVEIGAGQASDVGRIFAGFGYSTQGQWKDHGGHTRVLVFAPG
jgi:release factor glutamine methyltransferase